MEGIKLTFKKTWTAKRRKLVEDWVEVAKPILGLSDWTIHHNWDGNEHTNPNPEGEFDALATMNPSPMSRHCTMTLSAELLNQDPEAIHQTLVHELVHCHLFPIHHFASESFSVSAEGNELAQKIFENGINSNIETVTDALADSFVRFIPAIDLS